MHTPVALVAFGLVAALASGAAAAANDATTGSRLGAERYGQPETPFFGGESTFRQDLPPLRAPAVPLVVQSPYQSIWSAANNLSDAFTTHWGGGIMCLVGLIRVDGKVYRFMGQGGGAWAPVPPAPQVGVAEVTPLSTRYSFVVDNVELNVTFTTPGILDELDLLSMPTTFINFDVASVDGQLHNVSLYYDNTAEVAVHDVSQQVTWEAVADIDNVVAMRVGTTSQAVLGRSGDNIKIDWGYAYVATPDSSDSNAVVSSTMAAATPTRTAFVQGSALPAVDTRKPRACSDDWPVLALSWDLGNVGSQSAGKAANVHMVYAYDEIASMNYFGDILPPLWRHRYQNATSIMLGDAVKMAAPASVFMMQAAAYDAKVVEAAVTAGGAQYAALCSLVWRQVTGALATVWMESRNEAVVFMKEISSDGDISTVDVVYPAAPMFLKHAPETLRLTLLPVLVFGNNGTANPYGPQWAPHHLGVWPIANVDDAHLGEQMPMEESGNMLLMLQAIAVRQGGNVTYLEEFWPVVDMWAEYLNATLPDPGNQLCTDDFEGPSPHNVNLAAKGIAGLAAYAKLCELRGDAARATAYTKSAKAYLTYWLRNSTVGSGGSLHTRLQYNTNASTYSLKYNLLFDTIADGTALFPPTVMAADDAFYISQHLNTYGVPLDNRATFTKGDWLSWVAAMGNDDQFAKLIECVFRFADETPDRVPLSDWYDTVSGHHTGFVARPVLGGFWARQLMS